MVKTKQNPYEAGWNACRAAHRDELVKLIRIKRAVRCLLQAIRIFGWTQPHYIDQCLRILDERFKGSPADDYLEDTMEMECSMVECGLCERKVVQP